MFRVLRLASVLLTLLTTALLFADEPFSTAISGVKVGEVKKTEVIDVPYFTWGGDVATFMANGGNKETKPNTLFAKSGLKFNLVPGDDFGGQVKNYLEGKTPFLRGTMSQLGQASEYLGKDPRTKPVVFLQLTWSAGDHMVSRPTCKTLNDLKGKKVVLQKGGPHVGMLNDILNTAKLGWKDITVVWVDDVTGDKGPAAKFRSDKTIDCCFVISPDMEALTGGLDKVGDSDLEGKVKSAHVLVSTASMTRSIADVYACRKDFYDQNKDLVAKLAADYIKACEELVELRKKWDAKKNQPIDNRYKAVLKMTADIYGKDVIGEQKDAHGLIMDANFVGLRGNAVFFRDPRNLRGFPVVQKEALDMAIKEGWAKERIEFLKSDIDYKKLKELGALTGDPTIPTGEDSGFNLVDPSKVDPQKDTIYFFSVNFNANQDTFPPEQYGEHFQRALEQASKFGGAVVAIRGHVDPTKALREFVSAGIEKGIIRKGGNDNAPEYFLVKSGTKLDLTDTKKILELIQSTDLSGATDNPKGTVAAAQRLSESRAKTVHDEILKYAKAKNVRLDVSQMLSQGVGITEPLIAKPKNADEAAKNRRVEFRILRVSPETLKPADFNF